MTTMKLLPLVLVPLVLGLSKDALAEPRAEGKWEITTVMEMNGARMPPRTHVQCFSKKDMVPKDPNRKSECKMLEQRWEGNTMHWKVQCASPRGEGSSEVTGEMTFSGDSMHGSMSMTAQTPRGPMSMKHEMTGKRLGACDQ